MSFEVKSSVTITTVIKQGEVPVDLTEKQRIFYKNYEPMEGGVINIIIVIITTIIILARCQHCLCSWRLLCLRLPSRPLQVEAQANVEGAPCMKLNSNQAITSPSSKTKNFAGPEDGKHSSKSIRSNRIHLQPVSQRS